MCVCACVCVLSTYLPLKALPPPPSPVASPPGLSSTHSPSPSPSAEPWASACGSSTHDDGGGVVAGGRRPLLLSTRTLAPAAAGMAGWMDEVLGSCSLCRVSRSEKEVDHKRSILGATPRINENRHAGGSPPPCLALRKAGPIDPTGLAWLAKGMRRPPCVRACPSPRPARQRRASRLQRNRTPKRLACLDRHAGRGATQARRIDGSAF